MQERQHHILNPDKGSQERMLEHLFTKDEKLTFFDIGSCEGLNSVRYSRIFPNAHIYAVEPLPSNREYIKKHQEEFDISNLSIVPFCFSDEMGTATFYVSSGEPEQYADQNIDWDFGNKSSSLLAPDKATRYTPWLKFENTIQVETLTLEEYCTRNGINAIDFIHMDVQGAELKVLSGAEQMLPYIGALWLEVENVPLYENQPLKTDVEDFLSANNFVKILDFVGKITGDQFWLKKDLIGKKLGWGYFFYYRAKNWFQEQFKR